MRLAVVASVFLTCVVAICASTVRGDERMEIRVEAGVRARPTQRVRITSTLQARLRSDLVTRIMPQAELDVRVLPHLRLGTGYTYMVRVDQSGHTEHGHRLGGGLTIDGRHDHFEIAFRSLLQWRLATDTLGREQGDEIDTYLRNRLVVGYRLRHHRVLSLGVEHFASVLGGLEHNRLRTSLEFSRRVRAVEFVVAVSYDARPGDATSLWFLTLGSRWSPAALDARRSAAAPSEDEHDASVNASQADHPSPSDAE